MAGCPNTTSGGCRCSEHHPGLLAYASDPAALRRALKPLQPHQASVPAAVAALKHRREPVCDTTMTCPCRACSTSRQHRRPIGAGPAEFRVRTSRRAA